MRLVAAIHDVTPALQGEVRDLWDRCRTLDITPALFVVPAWHGWSRLGGDPEFVRWIREREQDGAEVFLHGFRHDEWESGRSLTDHLRAIGRTDYEAEFLGLSPAEAGRRIAEGSATLRALRLNPIGFVAPAWLAPRWLNELAASHGLTVSEDAQDISGHTPHEVRLRAPAIRWSSRAAWRARASAGFARLGRTLHGTSPVVRLALHPQDMHHPATRESLATELMWWSARRDHCSYGAAVAALGRPARSSGAEHRVPA